MDDYALSIAIDHARRQETCIESKSLSHFKYPLDGGWVFVAQDREGELHNTDCIARWGLAGVDMHGIDEVNAGDSMIHEVFVGSNVTNGARKDILNFNYVYGGTIDSSGVLKRVLYERISGEDQFDEIVDTLTYDMYYSFVIQLIFTTIYGMERFSWVHGHLDVKHVICRPVNDVWVEYPVLGQVMYVRVNSILTLTNYARSHVKYKGVEYGRVNSDVNDVHKFIESTRDIFRERSSPLASVAEVLLVYWTAAISPDVRGFLQYVVDANVDKFWETVTPNTPPLILVSYHRPGFYNSLIDLYDRDATRMSVDENEYMVMRDAFLVNVKMVRTRILDLIEELSSPSVVLALTPSNIERYPDASFYTLETISALRGYMNKVVELRWLRKRYEFYLIVGKDVFTSRNDGEAYAFIQEASSEFDAKMNVDNLTERYYGTLTAIHKKVHSVIGAAHLQLNPALRPYLTMSHECS